MDKNQIIARIIGVLYIIGTVAGIISASMSEPLRAVGTDYLVEIATDGNTIIIAAFFVLIMGLALSLIPIVAFPVLKKQNESLALGYILFRGALETMTIYLVTVVIWLTLVPLSQEYAKVSGAEASNYQALGTMLREAADFMGVVGTYVFLIGAGMFYFLLYRSQIVPRWISGWGLIGIFPYLAAAVLVMFNSIEHFSETHILLNLPLALQEMVLALWLVIRGFNPSALDALANKEAITP